MYTGRNESKEETTLACTIIRKQFYLHVTAEIKLQATIKRRWAWREARRGHRINRGGITRKRRRLSLLGLRLCAALVRLTPPQFKDKEAKESVRSRAEMRASVTHWKTSARVISAPPELSSALSLASAYTASATDSSWPKAFKNFLNSA
jgi:hypothetical protein